MLLTSTVRQFLQEARQPGNDAPLLDTDATLVVAVSGGPDSLALLHVLAKNEVFSRERLVVAHLDHGLRPGSAGESRFVAEIARKWGLHCIVEAVDVAQLAVDAGLSLEDAGRQARYRFLCRVAEEIGAPVIATAHNADDQAETVLMHFLRGTGLAGLRGMLPVAPVPGSPYLTLIRPLLTTSRAEIEAYCQRHKLKPLVDESNRDISFFRNRLRHELLPILESYNPQLKERLVQTAEILAADYELLVELTRQAWKETLLNGQNDRQRFDLARWRQLPLSLQRSVLRQAIEQLRSDQTNIGFRTVEQARRVAVEGEVGSQAALPGNLVLEVGYETFEVAIGGVSLDEHLLPQLLDEDSCELSIPGECSLASGWKLVADSLPDLDPETVLARVRAKHDPWLAYVDIGDTSSLIVRPRKEGERFIPLGMSELTKLKKVMINRKIPAAARGRWPIVATGSHLAWLVGHVIDDRYRVKIDSGRIVRLRAEPPDVS